MLGEFTVEDKVGNVLFASSPGMSYSSQIKSDIKKAKPAVKRISRKPEIKIFIDLAEEETDTQWAERFTKMSMSRFPAKISWSVSVDVSKEPPGTNPDQFYGELIYKNRQIVKNLKLRKDTNLFNMRLEIKSFIQNYTNIDMEVEDEEFAVDSSQPISKAKIVPVSWPKLSAKDQAIAITDFVKGYAIENKLSREESDDFMKYLIVYAMGRNILPFLVFDKEGNIEKIKGIQEEYVNSRKIYKLKSFPA